MLPDNLAISVIDVLNYQQKYEKVFVPARNFSAITLRLRSSGKYICKNKTLSFKPASICLTPDGLEYERKATEEEVLVIYLNMLNCVMKEIRVFQVSDGEKYKRLFEKALKIKQENDVGCIFRINAVVYEIFSELKRESGFTEKSKDNRIIQSAEYMRQNFWNPELSVEQVINNAYVSPTYFRREFNKVYGTSPKDYLDTLRMQYAIFLLETAHFSTKDISLRCGFSDVDYFRTFFKRKTGKSITQYRSHIVKQSVAANK